MEEKDKKEDVVNKTLGHGNVSKNKNRSRQLEPNSPPHMRDRAKPGGVRARVWLAQASCQKSQHN